MNGRPLFISSSIWFEAAVICEISNGLALTAASFALGGSSIRRNSNQFFTSFFLSSRYFMPKGSPLVSGAHDTNVPLPLFITSTPLAAKIFMASLKEVLLTPNFELRSYSLGSLSPGMYFFSKNIISLMRFAIDCETGINSLGICFLLRKL